MKRLAGLTLIVLATLTTAMVFWEFRVAVVLFGLSLAVAAAVRPIVDWFAAHRVPRGLALLLAYALCVGGLIALVLILSGPLFSNLQQLTKDLANGYEQLKTQWPSGNSVQQALAKQLPAASDVSKAITGPQSGAILQAVLGLTMGSFDLLGQLLIVLVLSMYWSVDQEHFKRLWLSLLPFQTRARAREVWQNIETGFGAYLRSQVVQTVLALILLGLGYQVLGLKYSVALALIAAIGWLIPWAGVLIAVIPAAWAGFSISPVLGLAAIALTIGVLAFLEFVIEPRLFKRDRFSSLLAVIVLLVLADEYGLMGVLVAPPIAAAIQIFSGQIIRATTRSIIAPAARPIDFAQPVEVLQVRLTAVQTRLAAQPVPAPELNNLVNRLTQLIDRAAEEEQRLTEPGHVVNGIPLVNRNAGSI